MLAEGSGVAQGGGRGRLRGRASYSSGRRSGRAAANTVEPEPGERRSAGLCAAMRTSRRRGRSGFRTMPRSAAER